MAAQRKGADTPSYLRAAEVADILHVSPKTVSRWAKEGKLDKATNRACYAVCATGSARRDAGRRGCHPL